MPVPYVLLACSGHMKKLTRHNAMLGGLWCFMTALKPTLHWSIDIMAGEREDFILFFVCAYLETLCIDTVRWVQAIVYNYSVHHVAHFSQNHFLRLFF